MAISRRTRKQQLQKDYEAFCQEERDEKERLEKEFWDNELAYQRLLYERHLDECPLYEREYETRLAELEEYFSDPCLDEYF